MQRTSRPHRLSRPRPLRARSRRSAVRLLALVGASLAAAACTPARILLRAYPQEFETDADLTEEVLRAFVTAVTPGVAADDANLTRPFADPFYPFHQYRAFFAADLTRRAQARFGRPFAELDLAGRTAVVRDGLAGDATTRRLYTGAVFLTQVAVYAGIYDAERGSALIEFPGQYRYAGPEAYTHPDPERFLGQEATANGNPS